MAIKSYLIDPEKGKKDTVLKTLDQIQGCETLPATNHELIVLVTDTTSREAEREMEAAIKAVQHINNISLVSGYEA